MSGRKRGPTPERQAVLVAKLREAEEITSDVMIEIDSLYTRARSPTKALLRAIKDVQKATSALEEAYRLENWHEPPPPYVRPERPPRPTTPQPEQPSAIVIHWPRRAPTSPDDGGDAA
jgi:hypothetical protein